MVGACQFLFSKRARPLAHFCIPKHDFVFHRTSLLPSDNFYTSESTLFFFFFDSGSFLLISSLLVAFVSELDLRIF